MGSDDFGGLARYQAIRRVLVAVLVAVAFAAVMFVGSPHSELDHERIETVGLSLILIGIGGRLWATLYIGGRKSAEIVSTGPYSVTRNPLYLFSTVAAAGVGAQTGSYVVTVLFMLLCAAAFYIVALREERFLTAAFGADYAAYSSRVPRFVPNPWIYRDDREVTFQTGRFKTTFLDGLVFFVSIPILEAIESAQETGVIPVLLHLY